MKFREQLKKTRPGPAQEAIKRRAMTVRSAAVCVVQLYDMQLCALCGCVLFAAVCARQLYAMQRCAHWSHAFFRCGSAAVCPLMKAFLAVAAAAVAVAGLSQHTLTSAAGALIIRSNADCNSAHIHRNAQAPPPTLRIQPVRMQVLRQNKMYEGQQQLQQQHSTGSWSSARTSIASPSTVHACPPPMQVLRQKKMYEGQRETLYNQQFNMEQTRFTVESIQDTVQTVQVRLARYVDTRAPRHQRPNGCSAYARIPLPHLRLDNLASYVHFPLPTYTTPALWP